ncbi:LamG domain-containing protein [Clostridium botulinum]|nr:LamG domain-containing protein [Clostridium botulinum]
MTKYYPKKDYSSNLVAKWIFDNTNSSYVNGNIIYDLSGKGNNLTAYNISYYLDAELNKYVAYFNGSNSYMIASNPVIPSGKKSILIKMKAFAYQNNYDGDIGIITNCYVPQNYNKGCYVGYSINNLKSLSFYEGRTNGMWTSISSHKKISSDKFENYLCVSDTINNKLIIYIDNLMIYDVSSDITIETSYNGISNLMIGKDTLNRAFKGYIYSIEIYDDVVEFTDNKYLIQDKNNILYTLNGTDLVQASSQILDESNFIDNGVIDTDVITKDLLLSKFENLEEVKLLAYTDDLEKDKCEMIYNCEPFRPIDKLKKNSDICNILFKEV